MNEGVFIVTPDALVPKDQRARDLLERLNRRTDNRPVMVKVRTPRNAEFSSLVHVVFSKLADGLGVPMDAIKAYLKEQTGRFDLVRMHNGSVVKLRHSVAFESMDENEFRAFWDAALPIVYDMLGKMPSKEYREIRDILAGRSQEGWPTPPRQASVALTPTYGPRHRAAAEKSTSGRAKGKATEEQKGKQTFPTAPRETSTHKG